MVPSDIEHGGWGLRVGRIGVDPWHGYGIGYSVGGSRIRDPTVFSEPAMSPVTNPHM